MTFTKTLCIGKAHINVTGVKIAISPPLFSNNVKNQYRRKVLSQSENTLIIQLCWKNKIIKLQKQHVYDIMDIPHQLEKLDNLHMRQQPFISY